MLIGDAFGQQSPVETFAPTLYLDVAIAPGATLVLPSGGNTFERAIYSVDNPLVVDGTDVLAFTLAVLTPGTAATISAPLGARCAVIGGEPLDGPRTIWWNFVSSSKERIERAKDDWTNQRMGAIAGEHEWIPLP